MKKEQFQIETQSATIYKIAVSVTITLSDVVNKSDAELMAVFFPRATIDHIRSTVIYRDSPQACQPERPEQLSKGR